jgi:OOP family OmpA-OmpF porin
MKKITYLFFALASIYASYSQEKKDKEKSAEEITENFNKWTIEATVGQAKGIKPYSKGYFSSDARTFLGKPQANSFSLGTRFMFSPIFGIKGAFHYETIKNIEGSGSLPFEMQQIGLSIQGVVNANRLFNMQSYLNRFNLLIHGGIKIDQMTSKTPNIIENDHNFNKTEYNGGLVFGVAPQYRISTRIAVLLDVSIQSNYRQHFNWDGTYSDNSNNLNGQLITTNLGLTYSLGQQKMHGDWQILKDTKLEEIEALDKRIDDMETLMNDTDKDGVPDYLDQENNSVAGVAVDSRGKMIDINRNGVPDELERYVNNATKEASDKSNVDAVKRLVNEGYVSTYFDTNKTQPTNVSTEGIDFIKTYLKNNPKASVDIFGHADEIGTSERNSKLSKARAESVKAILVKAGIDASRLNVLASGEDTSVAADSEGARKLVRRVTFRVKD